MPTQHTKQGRREGFDEDFGNFMALGDKSDPTDKVGVITDFHIKHFISKLLSTHTEQIIQALEGLKAYTGYDINHPINGQDNKKSLHENRLYNSALDAAIAKVRELHNQ